MAPVGADVLERELVEALVLEDGEGFGDWPVTGEGRQAVDVLPRLGVCGLVGVVPPGTEVSLDMDLIMNGRTIKGILGGDAIQDQFIPELIKLYQQGKFPFDRMITYYSFEEINKAVEEMEKGLVIKPVLKL